MKRLMGIGIAALLAVSTSLSVKAAKVSDFIDVKPGIWYYEAVEYAAENGLFAGTSANTFDPNKGMTRGMFVAVLGRKAGVDISVTDTSRFNDVNVSQYFAPYVEWAAEHGIVSGISENSFAPEKQISREQIAAILYRYAERTGNDISIDSIKFEVFPDKGSVSTYAKQAMQWAVSHAIINGSDGKLDPQGTATRSQVAQILLNAKDLLVKTEITTRPDEPSRLESLRSILDERLPASCQWSEAALNCGWYGPINGTLDYIADGCIYWLTELDGVVYDTYYIVEKPDGFYLYYG